MRASFESLSCATASGREASARIERGLCRRGSRCSTRSCHPGLTPEERKAVAETRRRARSRALATAARQALLERRPDARRQALSLAIGRRLALKTRLLALGAALLPDLGARVLARRRRNLPAGDERAPWR